MKNLLIVLTVSALAVLTVCALTTPLSATAGASIGASDIAPGGTATKLGAWYGSIIDSLYAPLSAPSLYAQDEEEAEEEPEEQSEPEPDTSLERTWNVALYA